MKVVSVVGNRPQFVKAAPLSRALRRRGTEVLVHTGQHYDPELAELIAAELGVPEPDHALGVGPGTPIAQTAAMLAGLEDLLLAERPDAVVIYGDTTTTLAGALAAAKLDLPLAHVEAGLRSFDRSMPEERNRVVADHLGDLLLCPTEAAVANLAREGLADRAHLVGDVMYDACLFFAEAAAGRPGPAGLGLAPREYLLVTIHRAAATDTEAALLALVDVLESLPETAVFPVHPRTRTRLEAAGLWDRLAERRSLVLLPPVGYLDFTALLVSARAVLTDSGGVQKEAYFHGVPCLTLREETEWVETVAAGWNRLVGMDPARVVARLADLRAPTGRPALYGDGRAAERVADLVAALADSPRAGPGPQAPARARPDPGRRRVRR
jgi:UDP-N-acetylglucosamine 2-epimerase